MGEARIQTHEMLLKSFINMAAGHNILSMAQSVPLGLAVAIALLVVGGGNADSSIVTLALYRDRYS